MNLKDIILSLVPVYGNPQQAQQVSLWLVEKLLNINSCKILLKAELELTPQQSQTLKEWLDQIINQHKPYQYILGNVHFLDVDILVEPPILIPRLETEYWVDLLIQNLSCYQDEPLKILDLCSGSGCIAIALAKRFKNFTITAIDISKQACDLITKNLVYNQISNVIVIQSDLYNNLGNQKFDCIVSNPPYIPKKDYANLDLSVRLWEDKYALISPDGDMAIIEKIIKLAPNYLRSESVQDSLLWIEIDSTQGNSINNLMKAKFKQTELILDQFGRPRVIVGKS